LLIANVSEFYHVLPSEVARELGNDPEQLAMICPELTTYARAKAAAESTDDAQGKAWEGHPMMLMVRKHQQESLRRIAEKRKKVFEEKAG
jgi:hypothetical protein